MKKVLGGIGLTIGVGAGIAYSYYRGYWDGFAKARETHGPKHPSEIERYSDQFEEDEEVGEENVPNEETETEEETKGIECTDSDCMDTFSTERGMKIHYGRVHKDEED